MKGSPGANDNGSGVAAVIELARALRDWKPARTWRFALFVNEEPPFFESGEMGSAVYARRCPARGERIVANVLDRDDRLLLGRSRAASTIRSRSGSFIRIAAISSPSSPTSDRAR